MRARWVIVIAGAIAAAVAFSGCGPDHGPSGGGGGTGGGGNEFGGCSTASDGLIALAWTIHGQPPTAQSCAGIDHLVLDIAPDRCLGAVEIEPVPCALDHAEYSRIPEGSASVQLTGVDAAGRPVVRAAGRAQSQPATAAPTPLDLE